MAFVSVRVIGLKETQVYLKKLVRKTPKLALRLTRTIAQRIVQVAKEKVAPLRSGTGALRSSIEYHKDGDGYVVTAGKGLARPYAYYQEFGFSPHFVSRKQFGAKAFGRRMKVAQFFPYLSKGYRKALRRLNSDMNRTANKIVRG